MAKQSLEEDFERARAEQRSTRRAENFIAHYFCTYRTLRDALAAWGADTPKRTPLSEQEQAARLSDLESRLAANETAWREMHQRSEETLARLGERSLEEQTELHYLWEEYRSLEPEADFLRRWQEEPLKKKVVKKILKALGKNGDDYRLGSIALFEAVDELRRASGSGGREVEGPKALKHPDPLVRLATRLEYGAWHLFLAYMDPELFFQKLLPQVYPEDFELEKIGPFKESYEWGEVGYLIETWGIGLLLNSKVSEAFVAQCRDPRVANLTLSQALSRRQYHPKGGRPHGKHDSKPRRRRAEVVETEPRVYRVAREIEDKYGYPRGGVKAALLIEAKRAEVTPEAIRKRLYRRPKSEK